MRISDYCDFVAISALISRENFRVYSLKALNLFYEKSHVDLTSYFLIKKNSYFCEIVYNKSKKKWEPLMPRTGNLDSVFFDES